MEMDNVYIFNTLANLPADGETPGGIPRCQASLPDDRENLWRHISQSFSQWNESDFEKLNQIDYFFETAWRQVKRQGIYIL